MIGPNKAGTQIVLYWIKKTTFVDQSILRQPRNIVINRYRIIDSRIEKDMEEREIKELNTSVGGERQRERELGRELER